MLIKVYDIGILKHKISKCLFSCLQQLTMTDKNIVFQFKFDRVTMKTYILFYPGYIGTLIAHTSINSLTEK